MVNEDMNRLSTSEKLNVRCPMCGVVVGTASDTVEDFEDEVERLITKHRVSGKCTG